MRDAELKEHISEVFEANYRVYGARKIWRELNRQGQDVARCTVERLLRELGITGAVRGKRVITTLPGGQAGRAPDLVDRNFVAGAPNRCWAADFTHARTWAGVVYVAFVVDTFSRRIAGWSAATAKETVFVLNALEMAIWQHSRGQHPVQAGKLVHHSDAGSQYTSVRLADHLEAAGIRTPGEAGARVTAPRGRHRDGPGTPRESGPFSGCAGVPGSVCRVRGTGRTCLPAEAHVLRAFRQPSAMSVSWSWGRTPGHGP